MNRFDLSVPLFHLRQYRNKGNGVLPRFAELVVPPLRSVFLQE